MKKYSNEEISQIISLYDKNISIYSIAKQTNRPYISIYSFLNTRGIHKAIDAKLLKTSDNEQKNIIKLFKNGFSIIDISKKTNRCTMTVTKYIKRYKNEQKNIKL